MKTYQTEQVKELLSMQKFREHTSHNHPQETILLASLFTLNKALFCKFMLLL